MDHRVGPDDFLLKPIAYAGNTAFGTVEIGGRVVADTEASKVMRVSTGTRGPTP
jgi:hypothetical protein